MDVRSYEEQQETMALLKVLAIGNRDIENGKFRSAKDVFVDSASWGAGCHNWSAIFSPVAVACSNRRDYSDS